MFLVLILIGVMGHQGIPAAALQTEQQKLTIDSIEQEACVEAVPAPWKTTIQKAYVFQVSALPSAPSLDRVYSPQQYPASWSFVGGTGYVMILQYSNTPVGPYSELVYVPGRFQYDNCSTQYVSVGRIWVDSRASVVGGRNNWGLPKQLAKFHWQELPGGVESVNVTDSTTGQLLLSAEVAPLSSRWPPVSTLAWVVKEQIQLIRPFLQVPITPAAGSSSSTPLSFQLSGLPSSMKWVSIKTAASQSTGNTTTQALNSGFASSDGVQPLRWKVDHKAFTGRDDLKFFPLPQGRETGLALGAGSVAVFPPAVEVTCSDSNLRNVLASMYALGRNTWSLFKLLVRSMLW